MDSSGEGVGPGPSPSYVKHKVQCCASPSSVLCCVPQAQARMQESSQKVDLLRLSLERRLSELPQDHPKHAAIKEELVSGASRSHGTPKKPPSALSSSCFFKPTSLTGSCSDDIYFFHFLSLVPLTSSSLLQPLTFRAIRGLPDGLPGPAGGGPGPQPRDRRPVHLRKRLGRKVSEGESRPIGTQRQRKDDQGRGAVL